MRFRLDGVTWTMLAVALAAGLAWTEPGTAQESGGEKILIRELPIAEQARLAEEAQVREQEAADLFGRAGEAERAADWGEAAKLYERSADLTTDGDLRGAEAYALAGQAYFFDESLGRASRAWEEAGNRALVVGDVIGAARNYTYAAVAAEEKGSEMRALELGWKAYHLTRSEVLTPGERMMIRRHLQVTTGS